MGSVFCIAFPVWFTAVSRRIQNKAFRADARWFTHHLLLTSEVFLSLSFYIFLVSNVLGSITFWDPSQNPLEGAWFLTF